MGCTEQTIVQELHNGLQRSGNIDFHKGLVRYISFVLA